MNLENVEKLAVLMREHSLTSVEVSDGDERIALSMQAEVAPAPAIQAAPAPQAAAEEKAAPPAEQKPGEELKAPLVGVVYMAPKPGAPPFVAEGQKVKKGQTLCIVEAMKVMNEFTAPRDGVVAEICVEHGQLAEHGLCLFRLL